MMLNNGILFESEILMKEISEEFMENFYEKIFSINSFFVTDSRFIDFNSIEIAISIINFCMSIIKFDSWKNFNSKVYTVKDRSNTCACFIVIER